MANFKVVILEDNEDMNVFTEPKSLEINSEKIVVEYDGQRESYRLDNTKEVKITINH